MTPINVDVSLSYPQLDAWPELPPAESLWFHFKQDDRHVRLGEGILTALGVKTGDSFSIAQYGTKFLLWKPSGTSALGHFVRQTKTPVIIEKPAGNPPQHYAAASCGTYVVIAPVTEIPALAPAAIKRRGFHGRCQSEELTEATSEFLLRAEDVLAWVDLKSLEYDSSKVTSVCGRVLNIAGLHSTAEHGFLYAQAKRFKNGLLITRHDAGDIGEGGLTVSRLRGAHSRAQLSGKLLPFDAHDTYRAIALASGLFIIHRNQPEAKLCVPVLRIGINDRSWLLKNPHTVVTSDGARLGSHYVSAPWVTLSKPGVNTAYYARDNVKSRLQVHGQWLNDYGFVAGARFRVEPHPGFKARLRAVLDPQGPHQVTSYKNTPKLYVPESVLGDMFDTPFIRVVGVRNDGLHLTRARARP